MWALTLIPDSLLLTVTHTILVVGVVALIIVTVLQHTSSFVSTVYFIPLHVLAVTLTLFGIYLEGCADVNAEWKARTKALEEKVAIAAIESKKANKDLADQLAQKNATIDTYKAKLSSYVKINISKYDTQIRLPVEFLKVQNMAAETTQ